MHRMAKFSGPAWQLPNNCRTLLEAAPRSTHEEFGFKVLAWMKLRY
jgi:hypothetical protein